MSWRLLVQTPAAQTPTVHPSTDALRRSHVAGAGPRRKESFIPMDLRDFASWGLQLTQLIMRFVDWALAHQASVALLLSALALFKPWGLIGGLVRFVQSRRRNAPHIEFGFDRIDDLIGDESRIVVNVTNLGTSAARKVRTEWYPESSCALQPPAQPFTLLPGATQPCEFIVRPIDAILRIARPAVKRRLGSFVVTYDGGWRRRRVGTSLVILEHDTGAAQTQIDLLPLPRKRLRDVVPLVGKWQDARAARKRAKDVTERLARTKSYLAKQGISVEPQDEDDDVFRRLLGELQRRGWAWECESHGSGYTVKMEKTWPPSSSMTFRVYADTREDVAMFALADAIQYEAERSLTGEAIAA
jgi:hypothetical protein